jgi:competence protein ComEC
LIRFAIFAFALGAAWLQTRPVLPDGAWLWLALPLLLLVMRFHSRGGAPWLRRSPVWLLAFLLGFYYAAWRAELRLDDALPGAWEGRPVTLVGRVLDLPEATARGWRFQFAVSRVETPGAIVPSRVQLAHYARGDAGVPEPTAGDCLRLTARLYRPHAQINPHGFDFEAWLLERGIRATGYLTAAGPAGDCGGGLRAMLDRQRQAIRTHLMRALGDRPYAGIVVALAIGDQDAIPSAQWTLFRHTGVTHLMSISGMHVTLFSTLVYLLVSRLWRRAPRLCLVLPARKAGLGLGLLAAAAYVALAGFGIPAQRTLYMLAVGVVCLWSGWVSSPTRILAAALLAVVLIDPWAALAPGFWLSFGAVAGLMYAASGRLAPPAWWLNWGKAQWAVTLALTPALLALFHEVSLVSPLANAFAIPLIGLLAVPLSLLAAVLPWDGLALAAHAVLELTLAGLHWLDGLPQPVWHGAQGGPVGLLLALLGAALLLLPRGVPGRVLGVLLFLPLFFPRLERPAAGEFWVDVLDVGQGLAAVVRTAQHVLVYDTGPLYASGEEAGSRIVAPFLHAQGLRRLDGLIVSHDDDDHSGGALGLATSHRPAVVLTPLAGVEATALSARGRAIVATLPVRACRAGEGWRWDGVEFRILHPPAHHYQNPNYKDNERSCVLKVTGRGGSMLLTGDIERLGELSLLERVPEALPAEVLLVPHHGSKSSSMAEFVDAVGPRWAVIPVGHRNRFGHPSPVVLARYRTRGIEVLRTDRDGAVQLRIAPGGVETRRARLMQRRYWHRVFPDGTGGPG